MQIGSRLKIARCSWYSLVWDTDTLGITLIVLWFQLPRGVITVENKNLFAAAGKNSMFVKEKTQDCS